MVGSQIEPSESGKKREEAASLLLKDYEEDEELTAFMVLDSDLYLL